MRILNAPALLSLGKYCFKKIKQLEGYEGTISGLSSKVRFYTEGINGYPVKAEIPERYEETIVVTNKRIAFISDKRGFSIPLIKLVAVTLYADNYGF